MRFISWNVNGLRARLKGNFVEAFEELDADFFCVQEIKLQPGQVDLELPGYHAFWNYGERKGYSGTAIFTKKEPLDVTYGLDTETFGDEGRVITLEYDDFYLVNVYTPNSGQKLDRLDYRMTWEKTMRSYLKSLDAKKPVIYCGDLNVAHEEIDIARPDANRRSAGFTDEEREKMTDLLEAGFIDTYRHLNPDEEGAYTYWSYWGKARERNVGWRLDYFVISPALEENMVDAVIHQDVLGSDHCPVELEVKFE